MTTTTEVGSTTAEINPIEFLSKLASSQSSGCLELSQESVSWHIYLQNGNINYASCSVESIDQLQYYLQLLGYKKAIAGCKTFTASSKIKQSSAIEKESGLELYSQAILWLLKEGHLEPFEGFKLLDQMIKDILDSSLWLNKCHHKWQEEFSLPTWIEEQFSYCPRVNLKEHLKSSKIRLQEWQKCSQDILSVHQRPYFSSGWEKKPLPLDGSLDSPVLKELSNVLKGRTSIRQLSVLLKKDELSVAQILSPYISNNVLYLRDAPSPLDKLPKIHRASPNNTQSPVKQTFNLNQQNPQSDTNKAVKTKTIVCIDDSPTILKEIQRFLDRDKFTVTAIDDPIKAASIVFRLKPDLILMDITMPKINGYKLCGLLRSSAYCNKTPIIMVTGNKGLIDKARAKLAGATDYLTKPFTQEGLTNVVEKHLQ